MGSNSYETELTDPPWPDSGIQIILRTLDLSRRTLDQARILAALCKAIIRGAVITDPPVAAMRTKGRESLQDLFHLLMSEPAGKRSCELFPRYCRTPIVACMHAGELESARGAYHYHALLTDMDALRFHSLFRGSNASSIFDLL
jgi:dGTP triphosphohydrolase